MTSHEPPADLRGRAAADSSIDTGTGFATAFDAIRTNVERLLAGKRDVIELTLLCLLAKGHLLVEDVPGVGKTLLAKAVAGSIDGSWHRVQFTPDLLPSDVTGVSIYERSTGSFRFRPGAVFANLVLCDEINRASPKAQAALLESMEEGQVSIDGVSHALPDPFMVIATQNPYEHEGTYPLPESQLDRFMIRTKIGYPDRAAEVAVLDMHGDDEALASLRPVVTIDDVAAMIKRAEAVFVAEALKGYIVDIVNLTRTHPQTRLGASPRAGLALLRAARARAAASGREYVVPDDIQALASPILGHRVLLSGEARGRGSSPDDVLRDVLSRVPVPSRRG